MVSSWVSGNENMSREVKFQRYTGITRVKGVGVGDLCPAIVFCDKFMLWDLMFYLTSWCVVQPPPKWGSKKKGGNCLLRKKGTGRRPWISWSVFQKQETSRNLPPLVSPKPKRTGVGGKLEPCKLVPAPWQRSFRPQRRKEGGFSHVTPLVKILELLWWQNFWNCTGALFCAIKLWLLGKPCNVTEARGWRTGEVTFGIARKKPGCHGHGLEVKKKKTCW